MATIKRFTEDYRTRHFLSTLPTVGTAARCLTVDSQIDVVNERGEKVREGEMGRRYGIYSF